MIGWFATASLAFYAGLAVAEGEWGHAVLALVGVALTGLLALMDHLALGNTISRGRGRGE